MIDDTEIINRLRDWWRGFTLDDLASAMLKAADGLGHPVRIPSRNARRSLTVATDEEMTESFSFLFAFNGG